MMQSQQQQQQQSQQQEEPIAGATGTAVASAGRGANANGGRFDFDDGGTYCGGWEDGKAHGHGVCTGPKGQGAYSGSWHYGFEVSGVYTWPSGSAFEGQWQNGKRHGLGVETRGRWIYRGEWTQGFKGRYGVRQSNTSTAKYEGTWANGLQDGYGSETYADDGTYQGQWLRGMRHGYGVRNSAPFGKASKYRANKANLRASQTSLRSTDQPPSGGTGSGPPELNEQRDRRVNDSRGGFVLKTNSNEPAAGTAGAGGRRRSIGTSNFRKKIMGITLTKQKSTSELEKGHVSGSVHSTLSSASWRSTDSAQSAMTNASLPSDSNASFVVEDEQMDPSTTETYMGEWKNDKRTGFGVSERSDGLKYEGEWYNNKKYGYGVTTFANGEKEEGKYKNNVLITNPKKKHLFLMRSAKFRERIDAAVSAAQRASKIAMQKADIAISRTATARGKAEQADRYAAEAQNDSSVADAVAKQYAPDFKQPGLDRHHHHQHHQHNKAKQRLLDPFKDITPPNPIVPNAIHHPTQLAPSIQINQSQMGNHMKPSMQNSTYQLNQSSHSMMNHNASKMMAAAAAVTNPSSIDAMAASAGNMAAGMLLGNDLAYAPSSTAAAAAAAPDPTPRRGRPSLSSLEQSQINRAFQQGSTNRRVSGDNRAPQLAAIGQQSSIDHFDHYKRPPSRDSSVDRYSRATGRMGGNIGQSNSRQASIDRSAGVNPTGAPNNTNSSNNPSGPLLRASVTPERNVRAPSAGRGTTPAPHVAIGATNGTSAPTRNGTVLTGNGMSAGIPACTPPPFEDILLKKRNLGQDIIPSLNQPKRTESLYVAGNPQGGVGPAAQAAKTVVSATSLQRKKSLPEFQELPKKTDAMSREEVSALGSARREEVRRMADEKERLRANPLLWLVSPQVKDWFSRQQLIIIVLFVNVSLAIMFFKLLT